MRSINLNFLSQELIPDVLSLDALCFGGLWDEAGYIREIESPNSDIIIVTRSALAHSESSHFRSLHPEDPARSPQSKFSKPENILGMCCVWAIVDEAHITLLAVHPSVRRQGLGKLLMWALLQCSYQRGMKRATLEVRPSNRGAIALYEYFGFKPAGRRKGYYRDTGEDALILWRSGFQNPTFLTSLQKWRGEIDALLSRHGWYANQSLEGTLPIGP